MGNESNLPKCDGGIFHHLKYNFLRQKVIQNNYKQDRAKTGIVGGNPLSKAVEILRRSSSFPISQQVHKPIGRERGQDCCPPTQGALPNFWQSSEGSLRGGKNAKKSENFTTEVQLSEGYSQYSLVSAHRVHNCKV